MDTNNGRPRGALIAIGGNESKEGPQLILREVARRAGSGKLVVATLASEEPEEQWQTYQRVFQDLGVNQIEHFDVRRREELVINPRLELLDGAPVFFFAGGDQSKITSKFGGTRLCEKLREMYQEGGTIAGTSSGASVMSEVMMMAGEGDQSLQVGGSLRLASGLGLLPDVIIDQHFAERGRIGRLLGAVAQNPRLLGIGLDEDTAIVVEDPQQFSVLGSGAVYVLDGRDLTYTNISEEERQTVSAFGLRLHVLSPGDYFDLASREPTNGLARQDRSTGMSQ